MGLAACLLDVAAAAAGDVVESETDVDDEFCDGFMAIKFVVGVRLGKSDELAFPPGFIPG